MRTHNRSIRGLIASASLALAAWQACGIPTARAGIQIVEMHRRNQLTQVGDGASIVTNGSYLNLYLTSVNPGDYDSATVSFPGPASPLALSSIDTLSFIYQSGVFADQAAMDAEFPFGTYSFEATNVSGTDTATLEYGFDAYPATLPYLTGSDYSDLQGMNAAAPFTFHLNPFDPGGLADSSFITLTIIDHTAGGTFAFADFFPSSTTEVTLLANTLDPGHSFSYELVYSNSVTAAGSGAESSPRIGFEYRTGGNFFTADVAAVPEPSTLVAGGLGLVSLVGIARRWRRSV